jgi:hypothetical protein
MMTACWRVRVTRILRVAAAPCHTLVTMVRVIPAKWRFSLRFAR